MITTEYDELFKKEAAQWLPEWDWQWLKAEGYAESLLKPDALSGSGAKGLMQIMDDTWQDLSERLKFPMGTSVYDPEYNIKAGVYYIALLRNSWSAPRPEEDRRRLAQASYNAGMGHILHAQKLAGKNDWGSMSIHLRDVTGLANAEQTINYVWRIQDVYTQLKVDENAQTA